MKKFSSFLFMMIIFAGANALADDHGAFKFGGDMWVGHYQGMEGQYKGAHGTNLDRFRIKVSHMFDDTWSFKGRFTSKAGGTLGVTEAAFFGSGLFMGGDRLGFGAQSHPLNEIYSATGHRWFDTKFAWHHRGFFLDWQTGLSYGMKFGKISLKLFNASSETAESDDVGNSGAPDTDKHNYALLGFNIMDGFNLHIGTGTNHRIKTDYTQNNMNVIAHYKKNKINTYFEYTTATNKFSGKGTGKDEQTEQAGNLMLHYMINDMWAAYLDYKGMYEVYDKNDAAKPGHTYKSNMSIGAAKYFGNKMKMAILYQTGAYDKDQAALKNAKDDARLLIRLAAGF